LAFFETIEELLLMILRFFKLVSLSIISVAAIIFSLILIFEELIRAVLSGCLTRIFSFFLKERIADDIF
jgi:hypothetical protein